MPLPSLGEAAVLLSIQQYTLLLTRTMPIHPVRLAIGFFQWHISSLTHLVRPYHNTRFLARGTIAICNQISVASAPYQESS